jgi:hypothetical protein
MMELIIKYKDKKKAERMFKHLQKEHPSTRRRMRLK